MQNVLRWIGICVLLGWLCWPSTASAHAVLIESTPAQGAILEIAPEWAILSFSEDVEVSTAQVQLFDEGGVAVALAQAVQSEATQLEVALPLTLQPGNYTLIYQVVSLVDGHTTGGSIVFSVGTGQAPQLDQEIVPVPETIVAPFAVVARSLELLGGLAAFGGLTWLLLVVQPLMRRNPAVGVRAIKWTIWGIQWGLMGLMVGALLGLLQRLNAIGGFDIDTFAIVLQRRWGALALVRVLGAATIMPLIFLARRQHSLVYLNLLLLSGLFLTWSISGHAAAVPNPLFPVFADWMHLVMAAVWLGGILGLAMLALGLRSNSDLRRAALRFAVPTFSPWALGSIVLVLVTGSFRAFEHLTAWNELWTTNYGLTLVIKLLALSGALALGWIHWRKTGPQIQAVDQTSNAGVFQGFTRTITWEGVLAVVVVLVTGALVQTPHPVDTAAFARTNPIAPSPTVQAALPLTLTKAADDLSITLDLDDTRPGMRTFTATIRENGALITPNRVRLSFESLDLPTGRELLILEPQPTQSFQGTSPALSVIGNWHIELQVRRVNLPDTTVSWIVEITR